MSPRRMIPADRLAWLAFVVAMSAWPRVLTAQQGKEAAARRQAAVAAAGKIDSIAFGLVTPDSTGSFGFGPFGIALLRRVLEREGPGKSRVLSPVSAGQVIGLVLAGARDSTALALAGALRLGPLSP